MCTLTFIPRGQDDFILTSNRDEAPFRSPHDITLAQEEGRQLAFPRDTMAGGTWLAASSDNRLVCLLNGAFDRHDRHPPYRLSRGLMVLEYFRFLDSQAFFREFEFQGMEPFTMVIYDRGQLLELRWDEQRTHLRTLDPQNRHIWSSVNLYDRVVQQKREHWFAEWISGRNDFSPGAILDFHHRGGSGDPWNDLIMNRHNLVRTVSISSIVKRPNHLYFRYEDLLREQISEVQLPVDGQWLDAKA
jgi:hypothetical protein